MVCSDIGLHIYIATIRNDDDPGENLSNVELVAICLLVVKMKSSKGYNNNYTSADDTSDSVSSMSASKKTSIGTTEAHLR